MGNSRKQTSNDLAGRVSARLSRVAPHGARLRLGLSGGRDSVALFSILADFAPRLGYSLECVHVHHGISPCADQWADFCAALCRARKIKLDIVRVDLGRFQSSGLEASARLARYGVLFRPGADFVVLAHHQRDQAETILLQLFRGSGVKGLSAMPESGAGNGMPILRPMLDEPFSEIDAYVRAHRLAWVSDESNDDTHFPRNFIRHQVLPVLEARFPGVTKAMARSASHAAEAQKLLDDLATLDLAVLQREGGLAIAPLRELTDVRAKNVLRFYFSKHGLELPQSVYLEEVFRQLKTVRSDAKVEFNLGRMVGRCHKGVLMLEPPTCVPGPSTGYRWHGEAVWNLPELGGVLTFLPASGAGFNANKLESGPLTVRLRRGGERMQLEASRPKRSLKNLLQEAGIPFWRRQRLPMVYLGDELVFVPGVGLALACRANPGEPGVLLEWTESVFTG